MERNDMRTTMVSSPCGRHTGPYVSLVFRVCQPVPSRMSKELRPSRPFLLPPLSPISTVATFSRTDGQDLDRPYW